jgi:methylaspartate mutase epsilon subunit
MNNIEVRNKKLEEKEFLNERPQVLAMWPTGAEVDLDEAIAYHKRLPDSKSFKKESERLHREGKTVVFPRAGTPILEQEIELVNTLRESGLPLIPVTPDSYTRLCKFEKSKHGLEDSIRTGQAKLNGYPTVNHGVKTTRKVVESVDAALNQRMTNLDNRLLAEIAFASGITAGLQDPVQDFGCYEKNTTLEQNIKTAQYVWRLVGYYADRGVTLTIDFDGMIPHAVYPLSVHIAGMIAEALLAAEQGVKSIIPRSQLMGHLAQDLAWARVVRRLVREYLDRFGYQDVATPAMFIDQIPLFPYPRDLGFSFAFINYSAMTAALAGAEGVAIRTVDESAGIPTREVHALSHRSAKWIFDVVRQQKMDMALDEVLAEERIAEMEVRALLDRIFELGEGDTAVGLIKAFDAGYMDSPFSSNIHVLGRAMGVRDLYGACRYLDFGLLPLPEEAKKYHREKIEEREKAIGKKLDYHMVIQEFWSLSKGRLTEDWK